jgi:hypothetical protein
MRLLYYELQDSFCACRPAIATLHLPFPAIELRYVQERRHEELGVHLAPDVLMPMPKRFAATMLA